MTRITEIKNNKKFELPDLNVENSRMLCNARVTKYIIYVF